MPLISLRGFSCVAIASRGLSSGAHSRMRICPDLDACTELLPTYCVCVVPAKLTSWSSEVAGASGDGGGITAKPPPPCTREQGGQARGHEEGAKRSAGRTCPVLSISRSWESEQPRPSHAGKARGARRGQMGGRTGRGGATTGQEPRPVGRGGAAPRRCASRALLCALPFVGASAVRHGADTVPDMFANHFFTLARPPATPAPAVLRTPPRQPVAGGRGRGGEVGVGRGGRGVTWGDARRMARGGCPLAPTARPVP